MHRFSRRKFVAYGVGTAAFPSCSWAQSVSQQDSGCVVGEPGVEAIGARILAEDGNAVDALVATALAGAVTQFHQTGIGGYGAHGIFAFDAGSRIEALDANSTAPQSFTADIFQPDSSGKVPNQKNQHGWLSAGVPGVLAGLAKAAQQYGSIPLGDLLRPAIELAKNGFPLSAGLVQVISRSAERLRADPGSFKLYFADGELPKIGQVWKNPQLAEMLESLASVNSVDPFYKGEFATKIAASFAEGGGQVTADDLNAYQAKLVKPLTLRWGDFELHTPPLTCGGLTVLQVLKLLQQIAWDKLPAQQQLLTQIEAMRWCWRDRLTLLGDPDLSAELSSDPQQKLLSDDYAQQSAKEVLLAVERAKAIDHKLNTSTQGGTLSFSAVDKHGNMAALTLTHGEAFGAKVTVDGLGLTLGHGMSRFDTDPEHPNAPGPGKRPLNNMAPFIITKAGKPIVAIGGRGGRKIPNSVLEFLLQYVALGRNFNDSMAAPRFHTEGSLSVEHQPSLDANRAKQLNSFGYKVKPGTAATLSAVGIDPVTNKFQRGFQ